MTVTRINWSTFQSNTLIKCDLQQIVNIFVPNHILLYEKRNKIHIPFLVSNIQQVVDISTSDFKERLINTCYSKYIGYYGSTNYNRSLIKLSGVNFVRNSLIYRKAPLISFNNHSINVSQEYCLSSLNLKRWLCHYVRVFVKNGTAHDFLYQLCNEMTFDIQGLS